jgi:hypothetical protein
MFLIYPNARQLYSKAAPEIKLLPRQYVFTQILDDPPYKTSTKNILLLFSYI